MPQLILSCRQPMAAAIFKKIRQVQKYFVYLKSELGLRKLSKENVYLSLKIVILF